jgi:hypothetical protein
MSEPIVAEGGEATREMALTLYRIDYFPFRDPKTTSISMPDFWGGSDEPLYTWIKVITAAAQETGAFVYLMVEKHGEKAVAHDYIADEVYECDVEDFERPKSLYFKVMGNAGAEELLKLLFSYVEEDMEEEVKKLMSYGWSEEEARWNVSAVQDRGLLVELLLRSDANIIEMRVSGKSLTMNGKRYLVKPERTAFYLSSREARLSMAHVHEAWLSDLANKLLKRWWEQDL